MPPSTSQKTKGSLPLPGFWVINAFQHKISFPVSHRATWVNVCLLLALLIACTFSLSLGSVQLSATEVWLALLGKGSAMHQLVVKELRLMRVLAGVCTGAAFALAGCLMQTLARNRLATPGIIGIDNAATAFAVASVVGVGFSLAPPTMSLIGAITATAVIFALAGGSGTQGYRFIVVGLGIGAIAGAVTQLILSWVALDAANAAFPWTIGSLNARSPQALQLLGIGLLLCWLPATRLTAGLNALRLSESMPISLGIQVKRLRALSLILAVILTGLAVAVAGPVGMIALLGPEIARTLCRHRGIPLLASALTGALLMVIADLVGRLILAPIEIPVGLVTAVVGSPYLLWMLLNPSFRSQL